MPLPQVIALEYKGKSKHLKGKTKELSLAHASKFLALQKKTHNNDWALPKGFKFNGKDIENDNK